MNAVDMSASVCITAARSLLNVGDKLMQHETRLKAKTMALAAREVCRTPTGELRSLNIDSVLAARFAPMLSSA